MLRNSIRCRDTHTHATRINAEWYCHTVRAGARGVSVSSIESSCVALLPKTL